MKAKKSAPKKVTSSNEVATSRYPPFTRLDQRSSATTADFKKEDLGISSKE